MKKQIGIRRVLTLALISPAWITAAMGLAILSAAAVFVPYHAISGIIQYMVLPDTEISMTVLGLEAFLGACVQVISYFASLSCSHMAAYEVERRLKMEAADKLARLPLDYLSTQGQGKLVHLMDDTAKEVQLFLAHEIPEIIIAAVTPFFLAVMMLLINWRYALVMGLMFLVVYRLQILANGPGGASEMMKVYLDALERLHSETVEFIRGIREIRLYGVGRKYSQKLYKTIHEYTKVCIPYTIIWEKNRSIMISLLHNMYLFLIPLGVYMLQGSAVNEAKSEFVYFLVFSTVSVSLVHKLEGLTNNYYRVIRMVEELDDLLEGEELPVPEAFQLPKNAAVTFDQVCFSYMEGVSVLDQISFQVEQGSMTALVGSSGSGKTTILKLLSRFLDVNQGSVRIGGVDIRTMRTEDLMKQIACVFQSPYVFEGSVADNIRGGRKDADIEQIKDVAKRAGCMEFIEKLPNGFETILKRDGQMLSGGEVQRLAIARAILKDAPIILLDEVTSAADPENELKIQMAISELARGKTVLVAAHRLPSIKNAKQILVLDQGRIAERGTHEELLKKNGRYRLLWDAYTRILEWKAGEKEEEKA